ncbi:MAG: L-2-hydroxyglutarate oxidase [Bacteroidia bacterium]|nr:L-2-hydroxyglutarate oxidase [Bacteroidia bacterium]
MAKKADIVVVGGGAVGLSTAWKLASANQNLKIILLEKEKYPAFHQTGHNSGVIHSGLYYKPKSLKATLCFQGREEITEFARQHNVKHDICGKIVVATEESELDRLRKITQTGHENGLKSIEIIDAKQIQKIEPFCTGLQGIWVPYTGIIDFPGVCNTLSNLLVEINPQNAVLFQQYVVNITEKNTEVIVKTTTDEYSAAHVIVCGGLHSDRLARLQGLKPKAQIVGFRGDYYELTKQGTHKVKNLIYPVPNPAFPFLGVHFTRMVSGEIECGPNAVFTFKREGYQKTDFSLKDTWEALSFAGTWQLFRKHWRFGIDEYHRSFSKQLFLSQLQRLIPALNAGDITPGRAGVRAMALNPDGTMVDDFLFETTQRTIHVLNAPSPAATACLAIGGYIQQLAAQKFDL